MQALEVFAIDKARCRCTGSIPYTSLQWKRRYYECGQFSMTVPSDIYSDEWAYICTGDRPETGRIQKVEYEDTDHTGEGSDTVTISGFFLESYMFDHTFLVEERREWTELVQATRPTNPMANNKADNVKKPLYQTEYGAYLCKDAQGNMVGGAGWEETGVAPEDVASAEQVDYYQPINAFFYRDTNEDLHWVTATGNDVNIQDKVVATDGTATYFDNGGTILVASGTTTKDAIDDYKIRMYNYRHKVTRTVRVKGYWQTLDTDDPYQNIDVFQHLAQWVNNFYQNGLIIEEPTITGTSRVINPSLKSLGDVLYDELKLEGASFRIQYDFELDKMVFGIYKGDDRTQSQTQNPWSVFSDEWGTLYGYEAVTDTSNYKNTCYVLYDYDEPNGWDGNSPRFEKHYSYPDRGEGLIPLPVWDGWYIPYTAHKSYEAVTVGDADESERAIALDLRSKKPEADNEWSRDNYGFPDKNNQNVKPTLENKNIRASYVGFKDGLLNEGKQTLINDYGIIEQLNTGTLNLDRYLEEFDMGDKVDMSVAKLGLSKECRIIGVDEVYEANDYDVSVIMGDELLNTTRKVRLV